MTGTSCEPFRLLGAVRGDPRDYPLALAMSSDGMRVAAARALGSIAIIDSASLTTAAVVPSSSGASHAHAETNPSLVPATTANDTLNDQSPLPLSGDVLSQVQFDRTNPALLFSASKSSCTVSLWDLRAPLTTPAVIWNADSPALSFDINSSGEVLAVGTELVGVDATISFWDLRHPGSAAVATFKDCHSDDVTQERNFISSIVASVKFHPTRPEVLMSGSTDGLVCIYNLSTFVEDDALDQVINDSSVSRIGYFGAEHEYIFSITHMETMSLWRFQDREKIASFGDVRGVSDEFKLDYVIDCTYDPMSQRLYVISGSQEGSIGICDVGLGGLQLAYTLNGGHSDIVRAVIWSTTHGGLVSAGEDGVVAFWAP